MPELKEWKIRKKNFWLHWTSIFANDYEQARKATIEIVIGDLFSNSHRDRDRDLKIDQDRDRDRNFRDRGHALGKSRMITLPLNQLFCNGNKILFRKSLKIYRNSWSDRKKVLENKGALDILKERIFNWLDSSFL